LIAAGKEDRVSPIEQIQMRILRHLVAEIDAEMSDLFNPEGGKDLLVNLPYFFSMLRSQSRNHQSAIPDPFG
jgi:hypothetical protein